MTAQELVLDLLEYIGVYGFQSPGANSLNESSSDEADVIKAVAAINASLQEINRTGPDSLRHGKRSQFFRAPTQVTLSAIQGELTAVAPSPLPSWMLGCSILIAGDGDLNEITELEGNKLTLLRAYTGATSGGLVSTVYSDAAALDPSIEAVLEPVEITPNIKLVPAMSRSHFDHLSYSRQDYGGNIRGNYTSGTNKQVGMPILYFADDMIGQRILLRLNPMPPAAINVTFNANIVADRLNREEDIDEEGDSDPGREFTSIPPSMVESILLPIARFKFFSHPALKNSELRPWVQAEYNTALLTLRTEPNPSIHTTRARYI